MKQQKIEDKFKSNTNWKPFHSIGNTCLNKNAFNFFLEIAGSGCLSYLSRVPQNRGSHTERAALSFRKVGF